MPGERGGRKCSIWGSILAPFSTPKWSQNGPRSRKKSGRSGLSVSKVSLVRSFRPVGPVGLVGLVVWVVPGGCTQSERRPTAPQELAGGPHFGSFLEPPGASRDHFRAFLVQKLIQTVHFFFVALFGGASKTAVLIFMFVFFSFFRCRCLLLPAAPANCRSLLLPAPPAAVASRILWVGGCPR